ncbi:sugar kinase [Halalkalibacter urbisdiaboli]|uniref:sugar kinase n=1 Tax=Halalkalibacter urbisdiaboli TaxID=1960589 RepID=UPI0013FE49A3|nr:sugar kinase [Halalkalibacter urbisdiaboli]
MKVLTIGEILVEMMRSNLNIPLNERGEFKGPYPSGAPAIFIYQLASLGQETGIFSKIGEDAFGKNCTEHLVKKGVDLTGVKVSQVPTGVAFVTYYSDGSRDFLYHIGNAACGQLKEEDISKELINEYDWLHLNGSSLCINKEVRDVSIKVAKIIKSNGGVISFDPNIRPELISQSEIQEIATNILPLCDYVMPSEGEELIITGANNRDEAIRTLFESGIKKVFLKLGNAGSRVYSRHYSFYEPTYLIKEVDPTGAGDSYCAGVVYGLIKGWEDSQILRFANGLGAIAASHFGPMESEVDERKVMDFIQNTLSQIKKH